MFLLSLLASSLTLASTPSTSEVHYPTKAPSDPMLCTQGSPLPETLPEGWIRDDAARTTGVEVQPWLAGCPHLDVEMPVLFEESTGWNVRVSSILQDIEAFVEKNPRHEVVVEVEGYEDLTGIRQQFIDAYLRLIEQSSLSMGEYERMLRLFRIERAEARAEWMIKELQSRLPHTVVRLGQIQANGMPPHGSSGLPVKFAGVVIYVYLQEPPLDHPRSLPPDTGELERWIRTERYEEELRRTEILSVPPGRIASLQPSPTAQGGALDLEAATGVQPVDGSVVSWAGSARQGEDPEALMGLSVNPFARRDHAGEMGPVTSCLMDMSLLLPTGGREGLGGAAGPAWIGLRTRVDLLGMGKECWSEITNPERLERAAWERRGLLQASELLSRQPVGGETSGGSVDPTLHEDCLRALDRLSVGAPGDDLAGCRQRVAEGIDRERRSTQPRVTDALLLKWSDATRAEGLAGLGASLRELRARNGRYLGVDLRGDVILDQSRGLVEPFLGEVLLAGGWALDERSRRRACFRGSTGLIAVDPDPTQDSGVSWDARAALAAGVLFYRGSERRLDGTLKADLGVTWTANHPLEVNLNTRFSVGGGASVGLTGLTSPGEDAWGGRLTFDFYPHALSSVTLDPGPR